MKTSMKAMLITLTLIGMLFFILLGSTKNNEKSSTVINNNFVSLKVKKNTLTNSKAIFILVNQTDEVYEYGEGFEIEKEKNGKWYKLNPIDNYAFHSIAYELNAKEEKEIEFDWEFGYGSLPSGKYRIVTHVSSSLNRPTKPSDYVYIAAEFIIE